MDLTSLFSNRNILVVGDSILDEYIYGKVYRISPEAPVPVVLKDSKEFFLGGAANVAQNITAFGSECTLISLVGKDPNRDILDSLCKKRKINPLLFIDPDRPTTVKTRIIGNNRQITRIDSESTDDLSTDLASLLVEVIGKDIENFDAIILQDYGKGMLTEDVISSITKIGKENGVFIIADPKEPRFSKYQGCDLIKPNIGEFKSMCGIKPESELSIEQIVSLAREKIKEFGFSHVLVTMSEKGMILVNEKGFYIQPGNKIEVSDVSGAGDTVSALISLAFSSNLSFEDSLRISNEAGSIVCQFSGAVPVNPSKLFSVIQKKNPLLNMRDGSPLLV